MAKNRLFKMDIFDEKAYLMPISFYENPVFAVFAENHHFSDSQKTHFLS